MTTEQQLRTTDLGLPEPSPDALDRLEAAGHARNGFCEKCWGNAFRRASSQPSRTQAEHYVEILAELRAPVRTH